MGSSLSRIVEVDPSSGVRSVGSFALPLPLSMCCASTSSMGCKPKEVVRLKTQLFGLSWIAKQRLLAKILIN